MTKNKYIAITLGPIYKLTSLAKKTKAMWASSYFFSYLGKMLIKPFKDRTFVLPYLSEVGIWSTQDGIGRFPDRYIFEAEEGDFDKLVTHANKVIEEIAGEIAFSLDVCVIDVHLFLKNYLKIYFFEKEFGDPSNIPQECNSLLDLMEIQDNYNLIEGKNYLNLLFEDDRLSKSFLVKDAFGEDQKQLFDALDSIAEKEIRELQKKEPKAKRMAYHNYVAIIAADGDSLSKATEYLVNEEEMSVNECLSKPLYEFGVEIAKMVNNTDNKTNYYGQIIYMGGDDLLLFSPVKYGDQTVFNLVDQLSKQFNKYLRKIGINAPTISFGVSIAYVKYPMRESLQKADSLLKDDAKNVDGKNALAFALQKHSGHTSKAVFSKNEETYALFLALISQFKGDSKMISSIMYWLENNKQMIQIILKKEKAKELILNYMQNSLNEDIHSTLNPFFETLSKFITLGGTDKKAFESLVSTLRFIHFLNTEKDE